VKDVDAALQYAGKETGKPAGVVGYCYGGTLAWLSATRLAPAAAVGYYGGHIAKFAQESREVPVMLHFGKQDDHIPEADVAKVQAAHPEVEIYWYDAGMHSTTTCAPATTKRHRRKPWRGRWRFSTGIFDPPPRNGVQKALSCASIRLAPAMAAN
jgi:dienelactone hydrolase